MTNYKPKATAADWEFMQKGEELHQTCNMTNCFMHLLAAVDTVMAQKKHLEFSLRGRMCRVRSMGLMYDLAPY